MGNRASNPSRKYTRVSPKHLQTITVLSPFLRAGIGFVSSPAMMRFGTKSALAMRGDGFWVRGVGFDWVRFVRSVMRGRGFFCGTEETLRAGKSRNLGTIPRAENASGARETSDAENASGRGRPGSPGVLAPWWSERFSRCFSRLFPHLCTRPRVPEHFTNCGAGSSTVILAGIEVCSGFSNLLAGLELGGGNSAGGWGRRWSG